MEEMKNFIFTTRRRLYQEPPHSTELCDARRLSERGGRGVLLLAVNHVTSGASNDGERDQEAHRTNEGGRETFIRVDGKRARRFAPLRVPIRRVRVQHLHRVLGWRNVARDFDIIRRRQVGNARGQSAGFNNGLLALLVLRDGVLVLAPRLGSDFAVVVAQLNRERAVGCHGGPGPGHGERSGTSGDLCTHARTRTQRQSIHPTIRRARDSLNTAPRSRAHREATRAPNAHHAAPPPPVRRPKQRARKLHHAFAHSPRTYPGRRAHRRATHGRGHRDVLRGHLRVERKRARRRRRDRRGGERAERNLLHRRRHGDE